MAPVEPTSVSRVVKWVSIRRKSSQFITPTNIGYSGSAGGKTSITLAHCGACRTTYWSVLFLKPMRTSAVIGYVGDAERGSPNCVERPLEGVHCAGEDNEIAPATGPNGDAASHIDAQMQAVALYVIFVNSISPFHLARWPERRGRAIVQRDRFARSLAIAPNMISMSYRSAGALGAKQDVVEHSCRGTAAQHD